MKALNEYSLMVAFTQLLNKLHVFANVILIWTEKRGSERVNPAFENSKCMGLFFWELFHVKHNFLFPIQTLVISRLSPASEYLNHKH